MIRKRISLLSLIALAAVTACETVKGAGQDIENAGEAVSEAAEDAEE
ncbi:MULTISPECIES: entericidin A/B family lipoprotein [Roseovarius]|nr:MULTISPECIES: entericidin A/B family lipoprotein [Roseovarius]MBU3261532.1 entericidin A/B family lipoprotein [Roseovarius sp. PS-C2]